MEKARIPPDEPSPVYVGGEVSGLLGRDSIFGSMMDEKGTRHPAGQDVYQGPPPPPNWPREPKTLRESMPSHFGRISLALMILIIPFAFFVLTVLLAAMDGEPESKWRNSVLQIANVAATLWPIFFATVLGTSLKTMGVYMAERGVTLGSLQSVMASTTMGSTVLELIDTRIYTIWTPALLVAWAMSPIGGQSVFRSVSLEPMTIVNSFPAVSYPAPDYAPVRLQQWWGSGSTSTAFGSYIYAVAASVFSAPEVTLMHANGSSIYFDEAVAKAGGAAASVTSSQQDLWGNVRVPFIHLLPEYDSEDPFAWIDVPQDSIAPYESLIGVPIRGIPADKVGNATLTIQSYYTTLSCSDWVNGSDWVLRNHAQLRVHDRNNTSARLGESFSFGNYSTEQVGWTSKNLINYPSFFIDMLKDEIYNQTTDPDILEGKGPELSRKQHLIFATSTTPYVNMTTCEMSTEYVDTMINCTRPSMQGSRSCSAIKMRHSSDRPVRGNTTVLSYAWNWSPMVDIPQVLASYHPASPGVLDSFLRDPPLALTPKFQNNDHPELSEDNNYPMDYRSVPMSVFEARLAMIINTYIKAGFGQDKVTGNDGLVPLAKGADPSTVFYYKPDVSIQRQTSYLRAPLIPWANTTGTWTGFADRRVYAVSWGWLAAFLLAVLVAATAAAANLVLRSRLRVPADFLQGVAALARDSIFVAAPPGAGTASALKGSERARALKDRVIMIRDVQPGWEVGRIALADASAGDKLNWNRRYE